MMKVEVRADRYVWSAGKMPRGYGSWAFSTKKNPDDVDDVWFFYGNYADAKKQAIEKAKEVGADVVYVQY